MYEMYPELWQHGEWGPSRHRPEPVDPSHRSAAAVQAALDRRDNGGPRPDDN